MSGLVSFPNVGLSTTQFDYRSRTNLDNMAVTARDSVPSIKNVTDRPRVLVDYADVCSTAHISVWRKSRIRSCAFPPSIAEDVPLAVAEAEWKNALSASGAVVSREGIEPSTRRLRVCCSAN
jgi:hypothetical protein